MKMFDGQFQNKVLLVPTYFMRSILLPNVQQLGNNIFYRMLIIDSELLPMCSDSNVKN